ncbi:Pih1 domain-containing protein 1 [Plakobranchus ocellatus]|uniref:PIH1 domain-containing protein 1 n=1 Tax=Plakobranchus ocellatus TaxID=259542 RepID=A0AAV3YE39_9GAST|nr:Pih1 domain-containing protein 1 [Plakobranchus ocellatus]
MEDSLLDQNNAENQLSDDLLRKLLLDSANAAQNKKLPQQTSSGVPYTTIKPIPVMCLKTRTDTGAKIFINLCEAENVPEPKDLTDDELLQVLDSEDPSQFRIPMSIGEPHAEIDKSGAGCTAYDVVVNPKFMEKMKRNELFKTFFLTIMCEGIESKYDILLKRDWVVLKNRKCVGKMSEQHIRTKSKPLIMDVDTGMPDQLPVEQPEKRNLIEEVQQHEEDLKKRAPEPKFTIIQEPAEGHPDFLVAEIHLPNIKTTQSLTLDIGEDHLVLTTRSHVYHLDIFLPFNLVTDECGAQFDRASKILTVTMPVQDES